MATLRDIKKRIRAVINTRQITKAMEMVAAARLRKAQQMVEQSRPYADKMRLILEQISSASAAIEHPYFEQREVKTRVLVVFTSDRGLCGSYNTNVIRFIGQQFDHYRLPVSYIAVGRKGSDLLIRRRKNLLADVSNLPAAPSFADVSAIGRLAVDEFEKGAVDEVYLVYTDFINMARQLTTMKKLLPLLLAVSLLTSCNTQTGYTHAPEEFNAFDRRAVARVRSLFLAKPEVLNSIAAEYLDEDKPELHPCRPDDYEVSKVIRRDLKEIQGEYLEEIHVICRTSTAQSDTLQFEWVFDGDLSRLSEFKFGFEPDLDDLEPR